VSVENRGFAGKGRNADLQVGKASVHKTRQDWRIMCRAFSAD
jgi:hypothetical protein